MSPLNFISVLSVLLLSKLVRCELGLMQILLTGMQEKCFIEELPAKTVILAKHEASLVDSTTLQPITHIPMNMLVTVRDPQGHSVIRQQGKPDNKLFMTSSVDGEYSVCFQAMPTQFVPNLGALLAVEFFIGDDRDPRITAPIEVQLHDLSGEIAHNNGLIADIKLEQTLQRVNYILSCYLIFSPCRNVKMNLEKLRNPCYRLLSGMPCYNLWC